MCTPYLINKSCGTNPLSVNAFDGISHEKMLWTPSLMNICSGLHLSMVNAVASSSRE